MAINVREYTRKDRGMNEKKRVVNSDFKGISVVYTLLLKLSKIPDPVKTDLIGVM